ncbi:hypothetical protein [Alteromonas sp. 14N.309.X.WAT.G.H12]|uniref:hypothetical protein n=1 Tax=Alteromonas sp. 14N.309.X.WAT.G.H12 TaxID=3120824 RepID=UPI002FD5B7BC
MARSVLNALCWALILSLLPFSYFSLVLGSYLGLLAVPFFYVIVKLQPYIFTKDGDYYFRNKPFKKPQNVLALKSINDLDIVFDSQDNIRSVWHTIKQIQVNRRFST